MYKNLLLPIALDDHKAENVLEVAEAIADADAKITLLHVTEHIPSYVASQIPSGAIETGKRELHSEFKKIADACDRPVELKVVEGPVGHTIVEYANENDVDCIVIYSNQPGMAHLLLGSTASNVVRHAHCAVHVIR